MAFAGELISVSNEIMVGGCFDHGRASTQRNMDPSTRNYAEVYVLPTGYLWLPDRWIFADGDEQLKHLSPDYSFLIQHPSGKNVLFDLGMRKVGVLDPCPMERILILAPRTSKTILQ